MVARLALVLSLSLGLLFVGPAGAATLFGPSPYLCFDTAAAPAGCGGADSPFKSLSFSSFFLETFEDGLLNTLGVSASSGSPFPPTGITDSVDADDGTIDGSGTGGNSFFTSPPVSFTFSSVALGGLPTHAGIVWTDGSGTISFSASGPGGVLVPCAVAGFSDAGSPDAAITGGTAEDRFFGCSDPGGISSMTISNTSGGIEIDHLQYGLFAAGPGPGPTPGVPGPAGLILLVSGLMSIAIGKRLRRR